MKLTTSHVFSAVLGLAGGLFILSAVVSTGPQFGVTLSAPSPVPWPTRRADSACDLWRPASDLFRPPSYLSLASPSGQCRAYIVPQLPGGGSLISGIVSAWLKAVSAAVVLGIPIASPLRDSRADRLDLFAGLPFVGDMGLPVVSLSSHSPMLFVSGRESLRCGRVYEIAANDTAWDETVPRWALALKLETAAKSSVGILPPPFSSGSYNVAVHVPDVDGLPASEETGTKTLEWAAAVAGELVQASRSDKGSGEVVPVKFYAVGTPGSVARLDFASFPASMPRNSTVVLSTPDPLARVVSLTWADALICTGGDAFCLHASWASRRALAFVPSSDAATVSQQVPVTPRCPAGVECVPLSGKLEKDVRLRFLDSLDRWRIRRYMKCPPLWQTNLEYL